MPKAGFCPICSTPANFEEFTQSGKVVCIRCGSYAITSTALKSMHPLSTEEIQKISGWIRENQGVTIRVGDLPKLYDLPMPSVGEKAEKILLWLKRKSPYPGVLLEISTHEQLEMQAAGWASNVAEVEYLLRQYLCLEKEFLLPPPRQIAPFQYCVISPKGWAYLDSLRQGNPQSAIGFVAMWFEQKLDTAFVAIEQGIQTAGYTPLRIDRKQHNNKIDDEIIAGIRRSKFLVADFTGHRGGVYFEAGFAKGLGLEVIWLCREDELENLHFDTRQYSHITWQEAKLPELTKALKDRIEATIGHGPLT
jgi:nucleoside 2-deoxyribosyltransferase